MMNLWRVPFACPVVVLVAFSLSATSAPGSLEEWAGGGRGWRRMPISRWGTGRICSPGTWARTPTQTRSNAASPCSAGPIRTGGQAGGAAAGPGSSVASTEVREFAVDALGRIGLEPQTVVPAIVAEADLPPEHINYGPLTPFRRSAARALGRFGAEAVVAVPMLEKALQNEDPLYRVQAGLALWKISQHPQAIPALRAALKRNESETAFEAVLALAEIGAGESGCTGLGRGPEPLGSRCAPAAASALVPLGADQLEPVAQRLSAGGFQSPAAAACVLGHYLDELRPRVFYHPLMDAQQLAAATRPVVRLAAPALVRLLAHPDAEVRQTAGQALSQMGLLAAPFCCRTCKATRKPFGLRRSKR